MEAVSVRASLPSNREAARLYSEGLARLRVFDALEARDLLQRAIAADPKYSPGSLRSGRSLVPVGLRQEGAAGSQAGVRPVRQSFAGREVGGGRPLSRYRSSNTRRPSRSIARSSPCSLTTSTMGSSWQRRRPEAAKGMMLWPRLSRCASSRLQLLKIPVSNWRRTARGGCSAILSIRRTSCPRGREGQGPGSAADPGTSSGRSGYDIQRSRANAGCD